MDDVEEILVQEGRLKPRPCSRWPSVTVAKLDMDVLFTVLSTNLSRVLRFHEPFIRHLPCKGLDVEDYVVEAINHYCHQAMNELWNRLRAIAQTYDYKTRTTLFKNKAPSMHDHFKLPQFYASLLSGIGPLHISDSLCDTIIIYAPEDNRPYFGRSQKPEIKFGIIDQVLQAFRGINMPLSCIETKNVRYDSQGSYFTTCGKVSFEEAVFNIVGAFPSVNYSQDDIILAMLFGDFGASDNPFEDLSISVGFVDDEATIDAFVASTDPTTNGATPTGPNRQVAGTYRINYFGLAPPSNTPVTGRGQGIYVIGRGFDRLGLSYLAIHILDNEFSQILRQRILHGSPRLATLDGKQEKAK